MIIPLQNKQRMAQIKEFVRVAQYQEQQLSKALAAQEWDDAAEYTTARNSRCISLALTTLPELVEYVEGLHEACNRESESWSTLQGVAQDWEFRADEAWRQNEKLRAENDKLRTENELLKEAHAPIKRALDRVIASLDIDDEF